MSRDRDPAPRLRGFIVPPEYRNRERRDRSLYLRITESDERRLDDLCMIHCLNRPNILRMLVKYAHDTLVQEPARAASKAKARADEEGSLAQADEAEIDRKITRLSDAFVGDLPLEPLRPPVVRPPDRVPTGGKSPAEFHEDEVLASFPKELRSSVAVPRRKSGGPANKRRARPSSRRSSGR